MFCIGTRVAPKRATAARRLVAAVIAVAVIGSSLPAAMAVEIDGAVVLVDGGAITAGLGGVIAAYTYSPTQDVYYVGIFGSTQGLRKVWRAGPGDPWQSDLYVENGTSSYPSDMLRFIRSSDVPGGVVDANDSGSSTMGGILLNPAAITISMPQPDAAGNPMATMMDVTFGPGEMAFITDHGSEVKVGGSSSQRRFDWTKKVYRWDLRDVGAATTAQPDYSTGQSGDGTPNSPPSPFGALGQADWNDVFSVAMTEQAMRDAYELKTGNTLPDTSRDNFGRQFAWASDGQSLYAIDTYSDMGGLYKVSATDGTVELIYSEPDLGSGTNVISEPAVLHTTVRDLGAGFGAGDQILFDGSDWTNGGANPNPGGINYVVDTGAAVSGPQVLFTGAAFADYVGLPFPGDDDLGSVRSIATDSSGNVYFYDSETHCLHKYDTQGRLSNVLNKAQLYEVNEANDGRRSDGGGMLRLQVREDVTGTWVTWRGDNKYIGGVHIFDTGDFDQDGDVDGDNIGAGSGDKGFFVTQFNKTFHGGVPAPQDNGDPIEDFVDYIAADVNGSSRPYKGTTSNPTAGGLEESSVDYKDLEVLSQFIPLGLGDFNWDGNVLDAADWAIFNTHFEQDPATFGWDAFSWFDGDVTGRDGSDLTGIPDGLVDGYDLAYLNGTMSVPEPATIVLLVLGAAAVFLSRRRRRVRA